MANDIPKQSSATQSVPSTPARDAATTPCAMRRPGKRTSVCVPSEQLFAGADEVHIEHRGALYRLQQTSLGKLILTK